MSSMSGKEPSSGALPNPKEKPTYFKTEKESEPVTLETSA